MANPFYIKQINLDAPFCNRVKEIDELTAFAESKNNVVLHSPRRFGKTSLAHRVQKRLADLGAVTIFTDFFGVGSVDEVAERMAEAVFTVTRGNEPVWKTAMRLITSFRPLLRPNEDGGFELTVEHAGGKRGLPLLRDTLESLGNFIRDAKCLVHIVLDEFQEIVTLPDYLKIEAVMRTEIQKHEASYFFVGSRRRVLNAIFNERERPFFRSAFDYQLKPLPEDELGVFIARQFAVNGKTCGSTESLSLVKLVNCYPYYAQKLAHFVYERSGLIVTPNDVKDGFNDLLSTEKTVFEAIVQGIPSQQRLFLRALAIEPTDHPYSKNYARQHNIGSLSALQNAVKQLEQLDLIEKDENGVWRLVDPIFCIWLIR